MTENRTITVYGASGHTGRFVVAELRRRGWVPVLSGRDPDKLRAAAEGGPGELEIRPAAVDSSGRSSQTFLVDVVVRSGTTERRAVAGGRDIYAISAPLVVEATERVLGGLVERTGALTAGQAFDAGDFLRSLPFDHVSLP
jgi:uncharacterized protein YbjT (DUF2867 family)